MADTSKNLTKNATGLNVPKRKNISGTYFKRFAWRTTAAYLWIKFVALILGVHGSIENFEDWISGNLLFYLSSVGFAPAYSLNSPSIIYKLVWVLIITGFKLSQVIGFFFYFIFFPVGAIILILFYSYFKSDDDSSESSKQGLVKSRSQKFKWFALCTSLLVVWFLLYGNAETKAQIIHGVILSGTLFFILMYRLFARVKVSKDTNLSLFHTLTIFVNTSSDSLNDRIKKEYKKATEIQAEERINKFTRNITRRTTLLIRGQNGRNKVFLYVLGDYIASFVITTMAAILFWALLIKIEAPIIISLSTCLHLAISYFLPGVPSPDTRILAPIWISVGSSSTAIILLVLYVGAAGSILPEKQRAAINGLNELYSRPVA